MPACQAHASMHSELSQTTVRISQVHHCRFTLSAAETQLSDLLRGRASLAKWCHEHQVAFDVPHVTCLHSEGSVSRHILGPRWKSFEASLVELAQSRVSR